ncbi:acyl-coenzyme A thioesterase 9, mitochondrial-like isoform X1 [Ipomoea triloba]|uniref:acyl-coenzyme A thioesterase 9, mitochondrial-like isoform X1 n=1 Tax=Ipomoea triloba TaxID=35885 RepID=UPI00125E12F1|nr:acyl-coenzyme A thioesterase 9, mitochondrial-like isoform X1 [Ipomoea triloba]
MKPRRAPPFSQYLSKPPSTSSIDFKVRIYESVSSLHTLVSHFLIQESTQTLPSPNKLTNAHIFNPSKQRRTIAKISSCDQVSRNFNWFVSSSKPQSYELSPTHSLCSSKKAESIFTAAFCGQIVSHISQLRRFSSSPKGPSSSGDSMPIVSSEDSLDAGSSIRKPTNLWPGMYYSPVTNALWEARSSVFEALSNATVDAPPQSELMTKTPGMSRTSVSYKFSTDYALREQYRNPWNMMRMGRLVEDLDALAGTISYKHCSDNDIATRPLLLVTASVDKMVLKKPIRIDLDLKIEGAVTWVGRSSMEIQLKVIQPSPDTSDSLALTANFTFVARDSVTGKSAPVNQISPETEDEKLLWSEAEERNKMRKKSSRGEQKKKVDIDEVNRLNELLAEGRVFCDMPALADRDSILIQDTCLQNSLICQPQQRNIHGRIFGGFLMRRAFELAYATAYAFAGSAPCFKEVDHIDFLKPVDVGNFLRFKSCVLYTELENPSQPFINVEVVAHVTRPELRSSEVSNKFYFTFSVCSDALENGPRIRSVVPATEEEARRVIERMDAEKCC